MSFRVTILPIAREDINRNAEWWAAHHSLEQSLVWIDAIYDQLETLCEFPESYSLSAENDEFDFEIREKLVGIGSHRRYRAVFTIKGEEVFVLSVRAVEEDRLKIEDLE